MIPYYTRVVFNKTYLRIYLAADICLSVCFWFSSRLFSVLRYPSQSGWLLERDSLHTFVSFALIDIVSSPRFSVCTVHTNRAAHHRLSTPSIHPPNHLSRCVVPHLPLWLWLRCPLLSLRPPSCRYPKIDLLSWQVRIARYMHQRFQLSCQHMFIPQYSFPVVLFCPSHLPVCVLNCVIASTWSFKASRSPVGR